jgi:para-aminobenzoate synthetase
MPDLTVTCEPLREAIQRRLAHQPPPLLVALDGGSGAGKSTLATWLAGQLDAAWVHMDDFFAADVPDATWDTCTVQERLRDVFDWARLRAEALEPLLAGEVARWHPFDFAGGLREDGTYGMRDDYVELEPAPIVLLDGAYSAHPKLADLVDFAVLIDVPVGVRHNRQAAREDSDFLAKWHRRWDPVEKYYFTQVRPPSSFDLVITNKGT